MALALNDGSIAPHSRQVWLNVHTAEKGDDFVEQFHVGILFLSELIM